MPMSSIDNKINYDAPTLESLKTPPKEAVASNQEEEKSLEMMMLDDKMTIFCENNRVDKKYSAILQDFFVRENKDKLKKIILAGDLEEAVTESRQIIQGYKALINSPHPDEKKILEFNSKQGDYILGSIFLNHGVTGINELQALESEKRSGGESPSEEQENYKNKIKATEHIAKKRQEKTDKEIKEIKEKLKIAQAKDKLDPKEIESLSKELNDSLKDQEEFNIIIKSKVEEYKNNIEEIKDELKKETDIKVGVEPLKDPLTTLGLKEIPVDIDAPKMALSDLPDYLTNEKGELPIFQDSLNTLPLFKNNEEYGKALSEQLLLFQFFQGLKGRYTSDTLSSEQRKDIAEMQSKGRKIPFGPDDKGKEKKIDELCSKIQKVVGPHIQQEVTNLIDHIKPSILEKSNKEFIGHLKTAERDVLSSSLDLNNAHYENGKLIVSNKLITAFSSPLETDSTLEVNNGIVSYPKIIGGRGDNSPLLLKKEPIGETESIGDLIHKNAGLINNKDLLREVLKSKDPKKMLEEKLKELKINDTIDSGKLGEEIALSGSQHLLMNMLSGGHEPYENLQNKKTTTSPLDGVIKALLGKDNEKKGLQGDNPIYKDIQSVLGSMKGWDIAMHNRFSQAVSTLSEVLKNPETEGNISNIIDSSEDIGDPRLAYMASLSEGSRKEDSLLPLMKLCMEGEKGEFNGAKFCNTIDELDFAINQSGGGPNAFTQKPENDKYASEVIQEYKRKKNDKDLEDALEQLDNMKQEE